MSNSDNYSVKLQEQFDDFLFNKSLEKNHKNYKIPLNHYQLFMEKHKDEVLYEFEIWGSTGIYRPVFRVKVNKIYSTCNCSAGIENKLCWHRSYILTGKTKKLLNENHDHNMQKMAAAYISDSTGKKASAFNRYINAKTFFFKGLLLRPLFSFTRFFLKEG